MYLKIQRNCQKKERSTSMTDVTVENNWTFELGVGDVFDIPIYVTVGFMQSDQFIQQHQNRDTFCRPSVFNAQCTFGSGNFTDAEVQCNYTNLIYFLKHTEKLILVSEI